MKQHGNDLLLYYEKELSYLRKSGIEFAKKYPKVAGRLELGVDGSPDPHVERLIESFAFITARIQRDIESEFPHLANSILGNIYPQLLNPIPSMTIAQFKLNEQNLPPVPLKIPKEHPLISFTNEGQRCRFRTCYNTNLYPLKVTQARFTDSNSFSFLKEINNRPVLHLRIEAPNTLPINKMNLESLRFYIHGERWLSNSLYEIIFSDLKYIKIYDDNKDDDFTLGESGEASVSPVGFEEDENMLPYPQNSNSGYRLIQEYFAFPEKFLFFDLNELSLKRATKYFDVYFVFHRYTNYQFRIDKDNFLLGCTPIINLFQKLSEPIRIDQLKTEYRVNPDSHWEKFTEIHSILSISSAAKTNGTHETIDPYFTFKHNKKDDSKNVYWYATRRKSMRPDMQGSEMFLSLIDLNFINFVPTQKTLYADILCTNRRLASSFPAGAWLDSEARLAELDITMLKKPTDQTDVPGDKELWRLISSLSLNYLSLTSEEKGLQALKEIISLYDFENKADTRQQISGISDMQIRTIVQRLGLDTWRGFSRGIEITLEFDNEYYAGNNSFLLASVLNRFFPLYTSVNSFTQLKIVRKQNKGEDWKTWPPRLGYKEVI